MSISCLSQVAKKLIEKTSIFIKLEGVLIINFKEITKFMSICRDCIQFKGIPIPSEKQLDIWRKHTLNDCYSFCEQDTVIELERLNKEHEVYIFSDQEELLNLMNQHVEISHRILTDQVNDHLEENSIIVTDSNVSLCRLKRLSKSNIVGFRFNIFKERL